MSEFLGLEGMDLSGVEVKKIAAILPVGRHVTTITEAAIERNDAKNTATLNLTYKGDAGSIRQWIYVFHGGSPAAQEIGLKQLKELIVICGGDGKSAPAPDFFKGKRVGVHVKEDEYNGKTNLKVNYNFMPPPEKDGDKNKTTDAPLDDEIPFWCTQYTPKPKSY